MTNEDAEFYSSQVPNNPINTMETKVIQHDFQKMSSKTARKNGEKYLGKDGTQAWRVSTLIGEDWYACMIYQEEFLPKKGQVYTIKISENESDGKVFKNWEYKLLTKKEQMQAQTAQPTTTLPDPEHTQYTPPMPTQKVESAKPLVNMAGRGASWNNAFAYCLQYQQRESGKPPETLEEFLVRVDTAAATIAPKQEKFVQNN